MNKQVLRILEMEFLCKNWFQNTNLFIHRSLPPPHGSVVILILWGSRWVSCTLSLWRRSPLADTPSPTSEWRRHFKMLGFTWGLSPSGISAIWINRFVFWNQFLHKNSIYKPRCIFCLGSSVEYPLPYNFWLKLYSGESYEVQGNCGVFSFFLKYFLPNCRCMLYGRKWSIQMHYKYTLAARWASVICFIPSVHFSDFFYVNNRLWFEIYSSRWYKSIVSLIPCFSYWEMNESMVFLKEIGPQNGSKF